MQILKPSLRKLESDLQINKTTLHNWKKNRPKLYQFIIDSYKDKELLKNILIYLVEQRKSLENEIEVTSQRIS